MNRGRMCTEKRREAGEKAYVWGKPGASSVTVRPKKVTGYESQRTKQGDTKRGRESGIQEETGTGEKLPRGGGWSKRVVGRGAGWPKRDSERHLLALPPNREAQGSSPGHVDYHATSLRDSHPATLSSQVRPPLGLSPLAAC